VEKHLSQFKLCLRTFTTDHKAMNIQLSVIQQTVIHEKSGRHTMSPPAKQPRHVVVGVTLVNEETSDCTSTATHVLHTMQLPTSHFAKKIARIRNRSDTSIIQNRT